MAKRKHIGLKTKLASALSCLLPQEERDRIREFPYTADEVISFFEWDHAVLHAHEGSDEWWNLTPMHKAQHREKSRKDTGIAAKVKRLDKTHTEHKERMATTRFLLATGTKPKPYAWPKQKQRIPNRPWPKIQRGFPKKKAEQ